VRWLSNLEFYLVRIKGITGRAIADCGTKAGKIRGGSRIMDIPVVPDINESQRRRWRPS